MTSLHPPHPVSPSLHPSRRRWASRARVPLAAVAALALALATTGCGKYACFAWTEQEGACPSQDEAVEFFVNPQCGGAIDSIDSYGEFDGEYCCYEVTKRGGDDYYYCGE